MNLMLRLLCWFARVPMAQPLSCDDLPKPMAIARNDTQRHVMVAGVDAPMSSVRQDAAAESFRRLASLHGL